MPRIPPSLHPFLQALGSHGDFKILGKGTEVRSVFSWVSQSQVTDLEPISLVKL